MKPKASLRLFLCSATFALLAAPSLQAIIYYWDNKYGSDLTGWTTAVHDGDNVIITVDDQSPNDEVTVKLKRSALSAGGKLFARLIGLVTP